MTQMSLSEQLTYSTVKIECVYDDGSQGSGTGFIVTFENEKKNIQYPILITNNHVVDHSIRTHFEFCIANEQGEPIDTQPLSLNCNGNEWRHHPNPDIDLCCLPLAYFLKKINETGNRVFYKTISEDMIVDQTTLENFRAIEDVTMVGYPRGIMDTYNHKPVIRKGTTATHPRNNYLGKPDILLDIAAYPGSSGSPVFILEEGFFVDRTDAHIGSRIKLLGVLYAGPQFDARGEIRFSNLPVNAIPVVYIPMNLGMCIKATEILAFKTYFNDLK